MWTDADFDVLLVLPLPEELVSPLSPKLAKKKDASLEDSLRRSADRNSVAHLRKGLQLSLNDDTAGATSTSWLIATLRQRVLDAGLACKVLKLMPRPDEARELPGEHEIESGHMVTIVCIGAAKHVAGAPTPPPAAASRAGTALPPPVVLPPPDWRAPTRNLSCNMYCAAEKSSPGQMGGGQVGGGTGIGAPMECFPRLEEEAERAGVRLMASGGMEGMAAGPHMRYRRDRATFFPPFKSKLRYSCCAFNSRLT